MIVYAGVLFIVVTTSLDSLLEVGSIDFLALLVGKGHQLREFAGAVGLDSSGNRWKFVI